MAFHKNHQPRPDNYDMMRNTEAESAFEPAPSLPTLDPAAHGNFGSHGSASLDPVQKRQVPKKGK